MPQEISKEEPPTASLAAAESGAHSTTLTPKARFGQYEVLSLIGSGGMGEVYRARDIRLRRDVAIKVLPGKLSADREQLGRLKQEARSASALNHPNIVTIYELSQVGSTHYIAMELVEGKTLRDVLASGPIPIPMAIQIAAQVAEGLAKAHETGIIHRDLKPGNLMITQDGLVKILDFGLAKLTATDAHVPALRSPCCHRCRPSKEYSHWMLPKVSLD